MMEKVLGLNPNWLLAIQVKAAGLILLKKKADLEDFLLPYAKIPFSGYYKSLYGILHENEDLQPEYMGNFDIEFQPWELYFHTLRGKPKHALKKLEWGFKNKMGQYFCFWYDPFPTSLQNQKSYQRLAKKTAVSIPLLSKEIQLENGSLTPISDVEEVERLKTTLFNALEADQLYLRQNLSLKSLVEYLNLNANKLSWLINATMGRNFNDYINGFRLKAFQQRALDPANKNFTLLGLAFGSGFNSKSAFNDYFKKKTGIAPSAWLKQQQ